MWVLLSQERTNSPGSAESHHQGRMDLGAVVATDVVRQLVQVVGESVLRVGALVDLGQEVTGDSDINPAVAHDFLQLDAVLPLDLVADMVLMPLAVRIPGVERLVGDAEGDLTGGRVEIACRWGRGHARGRSVQPVWGSIGGCQVGYSLPSGPTTE